MGIAALRPIFLGVVFTCFQISILYAKTASVGVVSSDYSRAEALVRTHKWDEGMAVLVPLLKLQPRNLKALNLAGLADIGRGDTKEASSYFSRAIAIDPAFFPALKNLSILEYEDHQYQLAEKHLLAASRKSPDDPVLNLYLGEVYFEQHRYASAANNLSRSGGALFQDLNLAAHLAISYLQTGKKQNAIDLLDRLDPAQLTAKSQFALGLALEQFDLAERSIPYLEAVSHQYPDSYDSGFDLAVGLITIKDYTRTIAVATALIQRDHETAELDNILAEAYEGNRETQKAVDTYRRAISLDPNNDDNYVDFATLCMDHNSIEEGLRVVGIGLEARPRSDRLVFIRGVLYAMQDRFDLAEKDFQEAASLAPQDSLGYVGLGVTYIETGNAGQAVQVLRRRLRDNPNDASLLYLLGEALIKAGARQGQKDYLEAQVSLEKSARLNPRLCLPHVSLGTMYLAENRLPEAIVQFETARLLDPSEKSAYSHLAVAYRRMGQADKSKAVLTSLKEILDRQRAGVRDKGTAPAEAVSGNGPAPTT